MPSHQIHNHNLLHYCRWCVAAFEYDPNQSTSPHMRAGQHAYFAHKRKGIAAKCDRHCEMRQQPEERINNTKLYGPGAARHVPLIRAEDLSPEDDHA